MMAEIEREPLSAAQELARWRELGRKVQGAVPRAQAVMKERGFVFDDLDTPGWQKVAFSLYSDLCEADSLLRALELDAK